jgi:DNA-binding MarR family transcriptional regulator
MNFTERFLTMCQNAQDQGMTTLSHLRCLAILTQHPEGLMMSRIAESLGLTTSAITGMIDMLERTRLVVRKTNGYDRRAIWIQITHEGEVMINDILS